MFDHGLHLTLRAVRRQIAAMPHDLYLIRLIHFQTRRAFPGERLWTATQLIHPATLRFLRVRNREGCDVYVQPYAEKRNPGYVLVVLFAHPGLVAERAALLDAAQASLLGPPELAAPAHWPVIDAVADPPFAGAAHLYADWLHRLRIPERFPQPDWSIADKWIAKELLRRGMSATQAAAILRTGSPGFPRRHSDPENYLSRTLARAARELAAAAFPRHGPRLRPC